MKLIIDLFPIRLVFKMDKLEVSGKQKLEGIIEIVEGERKVLQSMANRMSTSKKITTKPTSSVGLLVNSKVSKLQPTGLAMFNQPRKLPSCRICKELEVRGDNKDLYENHFGNCYTLPSLGWYDQ